ISNIDEQTGHADQALALPIVAVADGHGLQQLFASLGATVVPGGPARNPSTAELLAACDEVVARHGRAVLLPNHPNILGSARQAAELRPAVRVVPTRSMPQGIAALLAFDPSGSAQENA